MAPKKLLDKIPKVLTLNQKVLLAVVPVVLGFFVLLGTSHYFLAKKQILADVNRDIDVFTRQAGERVSGLYQQTRGEALMLADAPVVARSLASLRDGRPGLASRELEILFSRFAHRAGVYARLSLVDARGREVLAVSPAGPVAPQRWLWPLSVTRGTGDVVWLTEAPGRFHFLTGVFDDEGRRAGAVVLTWDPQHLRRMFNTQGLSGDAQGHLVDPQGRVLFGEKPSYRLPLSASSSVEGMDADVIFTVDARDYLRPLLRLQRRMAILSSLASLLVLLWIAHRLRRVTKPLSAMAEGTKRLGAGDLDYRFNPPCIQELQVLGDAFNEMSRNLKERNRQLEARIRLLTALCQMDDAVLQRRDEESILRLCLKAVADGLCFDRTALYWVTDEGHEIVGRYVHGTEAAGLSETHFKGRRISLGGKDILSEAVRARASFLVRADQHDPRLNPDFLRESKTKEFIVAPVGGKDRVFGVFTADNVYSGRSLEESDREGLTLFANAVGLALENARLFGHLSESEARYRNVLENSPAAVIGLSREHWITTWNRGAEGIFGYAAAEIVGKPLVALFPQGVGDEAKKLLAEVVEKGAVRDYTIRGVAKGGRSLELSLSWGGTHPDFWMNQEWAVVIRDVTEAKKLQQQLIRSEKLSAVGQLISGIAHELNNPLQAVVGYSQLLWDDVRGMSFGDDLRQIFENAMRCRKIIDNLLLFVRQGDIQKKPIKLGDAVRASLDLLEHKLKKTAGIHVQVVIPPRLPKVKADFSQIQQVFVNLITNACDAMRVEEGPKELQVVVSLPLEDRVRVEFIDTGPGVPENLREKIFEPFFTTKPEGQGTGLGLPVCRQIIEEHEGTIGARNNPSGGATFWLELPATAEREPRQRAKGPELPRVPGKLVLVVDDEPAVLSFLQKVMEAEGDVIETAATLHEAAGKISQIPFDLVITDMNLGKDNGLALYDGWSRWTLQARPPFLFITGDILNTGLEKIVQKKGLALLHKPLDVETLQQAVRTQLAGLHLKHRPRSWTP